MSLDDVDRAFQYGGECHDGGAAGHAVLRESHRCLLPLLFSQPARVEPVDDERVRIQHEGVRLNVELVGGVIEGAV